MEEDEARSEATFRFTVSNFSRLKDTKLSPPTFVRELPWHIEVMPLTKQGVDMQLCKTLGFFLLCDGEYGSSTWSCHAKVELRLLSQKENGEPIIGKIECLFNSKQKGWGFNQFMAWNDILNIEKGYIKDDSITLEVHVVADVPRGVRSSWFHSVRDLRKDEELADVVLECDGGEIKAHRVILSCRSVYFKKMFTSNFKESRTNRVVLPNVHLDVMHTILDFIYFDSTVKLTKENLDHVLKVHQSSHMFEIEDLTKRCWNLIMASLDSENIIDIWNAAVLYREEKDSSVILQFCLKNLGTIVEKENFFYLEVSQFKRLIKEMRKNKILVTNSVLGGIIKWYENNQVEKYDMQEYLLHLNYNCVTKDYMRQVTENECCPFTEFFFKQYFLLRYKASPSN